MAITKRDQAVEAPAVRRQIEIDVRSLANDLTLAATTGGAVLDNPQLVADASCCAPSEQATCCEPAAKASCCGDAHTGGCGCR